jgi:hypothetical protein
MIAGKATMSYKRAMANPKESKTSIVPTLRVHPCTFGILLPAKAVAYYNFFRKKEYIIPKIRWKSCLDGR